MIEHVLNISYIRIYFKVYIDYLCSTRKFFRLFIKLSLELNSNLSNWSVDDCSLLEWIFMWFLRSPGVEKDLGHSSQG